MSQLSSQNPLGCGLSPEQLELIYSDKTIDEQFAEYHRKNPAVYRKLVNLAREAKGAGFETYGIKALVERVRWHMRVEKKEAFKINNNLTRCYSRAIMLCEPDLCDFFEVRRLRSKGSAK
jgi:hypothetical protein